MSIKMYSITGRALCHSNLNEHIKQESADGTIKFLFKLQDGNLIETVMMRHKYGFLFVSPRK